MTSVFYTRWLTSAGRWIFLATLILAPWFYGGTTKESIVWINWFLAVALGFWLIGKIAKQIAEIGKKRTGHQRSSQEFPQTLQATRHGTSPSDWRTRLLLQPKNEDRPRTARWLQVLVVTTLSILIIGWWMVWNAAWIYDSEFFLFIPVPRLFPQAAGSVDYAISAAWMLRATLLIGAMWLVVDLSQDPKWLVRLWWTIGIAGGSIALFGLLQKATGAEMIFWQPEIKWRGKNFFATYYYHANAGAFLNLVWPPIVALAIRAFQKHEGAAVRSLWLSLSVIAIVAVASNTSRMAHFVAIASGLAMAIIYIPKIVRDLPKTERKIALVGAVTVLLAILAVAQASHFDRALKRWQGSWGSLEENGRWLAPKAATRALNDVGLLGLGPGTFRVIFPYYTADLGQRIHGEWRFLHEDYLQTLLEWGWVGSLGWAVLFFGGIAVGVRRLRDNRGRRSASGSASGLASGAEPTAWSESPTARRSAHRAIQPGGREIRSRLERGAMMPRQRWILSLAVLALCGVATHALIDFPLQIMSIQLYVATYVGLCWGR